MEKTHRRVMKRHAELAGDFGDLGQVYNGLACNETSSLTPGLYKIGEAYDNVHTNLNVFQSEMEAKVSETLHEYTQFADVVQSILRFRRHRQMEFDNTCELLNSKIQYLSHLEKVDVEARRLEEALQKEGYRSNVGTSGGTVGKSKGLVGALSDKLNSVIDSDPDVSRRHNIQKTRDVISQVL